MLRRSLVLPGRFVKAASPGQFGVYAITGTHTSAFAIDARQAKTAGLIGFAVSVQQAGGVERFKNSKKVFASEIVDSDENINAVRSGGDINVKATTLENPVQDLLITDHKGEPGQKYTFRFYPMTSSVSGAATNATAAVGGRKPKKGKKPTKKAADAAAAAATAVASAKPHLVKGNPIVIDVQMEGCFDATQKHDVFFNSATAASQGFTKKYGNVKFDPSSTAPDTPEQAAAKAELARDLETALVKFIQQANAGDTLKCCFYEFSHPRILSEFRAAADRGVHVKMILDMSPNIGGDGSSQPKTTTLQRLAQAGLPTFTNMPADWLPKAGDPAMETSAGNVTIIARTMRVSKHLQHNKYMVLLRNGTPQAVWTGSTNITYGGLYGQMNVGHWVRDPATAQAFEQHWNGLVSDPSAADTNALIADAPTAPKAVPSGITVVMSPRATPKAPKGQKKPKGKAPAAAAAKTKFYDDYQYPNVLHLYYKYFCEASKLSVITLPFGAPRTLVDYLSSKDCTSPSMFALFNASFVPPAEYLKILQAGGKAATTKKQSSFDSLTRLNAQKRLGYAYGEEFQEPVFQSIREEVNSKDLGLSKFVPFVHCKFVVSDPLGSDPVTVTGSANFSDASTYNNDENMLIIRGDKRVADIYTAEFLRFFRRYSYRNHVNFLAVKTGQATTITTKTGKQFTKNTVDKVAFAQALVQLAAKDVAPVILADDSWLQRFQPTTRQGAQLAAFYDMHL